VWWLRCLASWSVRQESAQSCCIKFLWESCWVVLCCHEVCGRLRSVTLLEKDCCIYRIVQVTVISLWLWLLLLIPDCWWNKGAFWWASIPGWVVTIAVWEGFQCRVVYFINKVSLAVVEWYLIGAGVDFLSDRQLAIFYSLVGECVSKCNLWLCFVDDDGGQGLPCPIGRKLCLSLDAASMRSYRVLQIHSTFLFYLCRDALDGQSHNLNLFRVHADTWKIIVNGYLGLACLISPLYLMVRGASCDGFVFWQRLADLFNLVGFRRKGWVISLALISVVSLQWQATLFLPWRTTVAYIA
jgi:hypothetical protein